MHWCHRESSLQGHAETLRKIPTILLAVKDLAPFDAARHHVVDPCQHLAEEIAAEILEGKGYVPLTTAVSLP